MHKHTTSTPITSSRNFRKQPEEEYVIATLTFRASCPIQHRRFRFHFKHSVKQPLQAQHYKQSANSGGKQTVFEKICSFQLIFVLNSLGNDCQLLLVSNNQTQRFVGIFKDVFNMNIEKQRLVLPHSQILHRCYTANSSVAQCVIVDDLVRSAKRIRIETPLQRQHNNRKMRIQGKRFSRHLTEKIRREGRDTFIQ